MVKQINYLAGPNGGLDQDLKRYVTDQVKSHDAVLVFDFDGVLSSNKEEQVYQAPVTDDERIHLKELASSFGIDSKLYDSRYLRHMVYQSMMEILDRPIDAGPMLGLAKDLSENGLPFYILTARSSPSAIRRVFSFCHNQRLTPQEFFFVGRVGKGRQLQLVGKDSSGRRIIYFEDSPRHVRNSTSLSHDPLTTVYVVWDKENEIESGRREFFETLNLFRKLRVEGPH